MPNNFDNIQQGIDSFGSPLQRTDTTDLTKLLNKEEKLVLVSEEKKAKIKAKVSEKYNIDALKREEEKNDAIIKKLERLGDKINAKQREQLKKAKQDYEKSRKELLIIDEEVAKESQKIAKRYEEETFRRLSVAKRQEVMEKKKLAEEEAMEELSITRKLIEEQEDLSKEQRDKQLAAIDEQLNKKKEYYKNLTKEDERYQKALEKSLTNREKREKKIADNKKKMEKASDTIKDLKAKKELATSDEEKDEIQKQINQASSEYNEASMKVWAGEMANQLEKAVDNAIGAINNAVGNEINTFTKMQGRMSARLQTMEDNGVGIYNDALGTMKGNLAASPYVSYKASLDNLSKLVDSGIAYNIEERAFLATISDKIATTFDVFDANLLRLIRIQQADTTAARMGMEASLTRLFNTMFSDTSYLSDMYDTVSAAIVDANSTLTYQESTAFEYTLQKWLGSLYSLGFSQKAVQSIASGINMLSTGDVQGLANNQQMQTLLAMSASLSPNVDFAQALVDGLDSSSLNELMRSMVMYLKNIANDTKNNKVVMSAYGNIFDMSLSDFSSIMNIKQSDIDTLYNDANLDYDDAMDAVYSQFAKAMQRTTMSEAMANMMGNFTTTMAQGIAESPMQLATWYFTDLIEKNTGGLHLPNYAFFGNELNLSAFTIEGIIKSGLVGLNAIMAIPSILSSISSNYGMGLENGGDSIFSNWNATQTLSRGTGVKFSKSGVTFSKSQQEYVGSKSSDDTKTGALQGAIEDSEDVKDMTSSEATDDAKKLIQEALSLYNYVSGTDAFNVHVVNDSLNVNSNLASIDSTLKEKIKAYIQSEIVPKISVSSLFGIDGDNKNNGEATLQDLIDKVVNGTISVIDEENSSSNVMNMSFEEVMNRARYGLL